MELCPKCGGVIVGESLRYSCKCQHRTGPKPAVITRNDIPEGTMQLDLVGMDAKDIAKAMGRDDIEVWLRGRNRYLGRLDEEGRVQKVPFPDADDDIPMGSA